MLDAKWKYQGLFHEKNLYSTRIVVSLIFEHWIYSIWFPWRRTMIFGSFILARLISQQMIILPITWEPFLLFKCISSLTVTSLIWNLNLCRFFIYKKKCTKLGLAHPWINLRYQNKCRVHSDGNKFKRSRPSWFLSFQQFWSIKIQKSSTIISSSMNLTLLFMLPV